MGLNDYVDVGRRRWKVIVAVALLGVIAAVLFTPAKGAATAPATYTATHTLLVEGAASVDASRGGESGGRNAGASTGGASRGGGNEGVSSGGGGESDAQAQTSTGGGALTSATLVLTVGDVPERVAAELDFTGDVERLVSVIDVSTDAALGTIAITATTGSAERSVELADTFGEQYVAVLDRRATEGYEAELESVNARLADLPPQIAALNTTLQADTTNEVVRAQLNTLLGQYSTAYERSLELAATPEPDAGVTSLQRARATEDDSGGFATPTSRVSRMVIAGAVGVLLGAGLALLLDRTDSRIRTPEMAAEAFGAPVLGSIPASRRFRRKHSQIAVSSQTERRTAESYRQLRTSLSSGAGIELPAHAALPPGGPNAHATNGRVRSSHAGPRVILVSSPGHGEGRTSTVANLTAAQAESGRSVLAVDFDLQRPALERFFGAPGAPGLTDLLGGANVDEPVEHLFLSTPVAGVKLLPSGSPVENPSVLLGEGRRLLSDAAHWVDLVVVDTPPLLDYSDAGELLPAADAVILVCRVGRTRTEAATRAAVRLAQLNAPFAGVVLVGVPARRSVRDRLSELFRQRNGGTRRPAPQPTPLPPISPTPERESIGTGAERN